MSIHVNIGEAKTRLSELVAAALRGEKVFVNNAGQPQVELVPLPEAAAQARSKIAERRKRLYGKYAGRFSEAELTVPDERVDDYLNERFERKFGYPPPA